MNRFGEIMINTPARLRAFMVKHKLANGDIATILGYKTYRYNENTTVGKMLAGEYNWSKNCFWVDDLLNKWVKKCKKS